MQSITSPTFTLVKEYEEGRLPLYHIDAYRLENIVQDLGFDEYIDADGVCVIEWASFMPYILPEERIDVELTINDDDSRTIKMAFKGDRYREVYEKTCGLW